MKIVIVSACVALAAVAFGQAKPLAGSTGVISAPAKLGDYQFSLVSANFATRFAHDETIEIAPKGKKLLVLNYTVQNPGKAELGYDWASIKFTVVGADTNNYDYKEFVVNPDKLNGINLQIKPAQKVPAVAVIEVPAEDPIPKLIVSSGEAPVLRFDLRGKVKKFTGIFAAPDGVTVNDTGAAKMGDKIELGNFDVAVEKVEAAESPIGENTLEEGQHFVVVTLSYTNVVKTDQNLDWSTYKLSMVDKNGEPIEDRQQLLRMIGNVGVSNAVKPGESFRCRYLFAAGKDAKPAKLTITSPEERSVTIAIG